jgi:RNA recognition motif-containing protein
MNIYVGNLSYQLTVEELREAFEGFGSVESAKIIFDKETGRSKGFGFVEMAEQSEGEAAVQALNGADLKGRALKVNEARPKSDEGRSGGGRPGGGYGGDRGGYGGDRGGYGGDRGGYGGGRGY